MNKNLQITVAVVLVAAVLIIYVQAQANAQNIALAEANRPIIVNKNYYSFHYAPKTTNIENVDGNGHTLGDGNNVQNEMV